MQVLSVQHYNYMQGKSLSLICGALRWLLDHELREGLKVESVLTGSLSPSALDDKQALCKTVVSKIDTSKVAAGIRTCCSYNNYSLVNRFFLVWCCEYYGLSTLCFHSVVSTTFKQFSS